MRWRLAILLTLLLALPGRVSAQTGAGIRISAPASGETLTGLVHITGTSAVDGFFAAELSFAYTSDITSTWFLIQQTDSPVADGLLAAWDTTSVTDGDYNLRLRVTLQDGSILETLVTGLRIRNQIPTETPTAAPTEISLLEWTPLPPTPMPAPTSTRLPTPTPLPLNPAVVTPAEINENLLRGLIITLAAFLLVGLLLRLRR